MAALDGNSILGKIIDLLLGGKKITTTTFLLSELASRPADAFIFRLDFGRFLQTTQDMVGFPLDHRKQLQEQHRISIEQDARSLSASTRQLLGIDEDGQVPEGQVPNAQALLTAYGAASGQATTNYKHHWRKPKRGWQHYPRISDRIICRNQRCSWRLIFHTCVSAAPTLMP